MSTKTNRLRERYLSDVVPALSKEFGYGNRMQIPRVEKIVLNMGVGEAVNDRKKVDAAAKDLAMIAGQRAEAVEARIRARAERADVLAARLDRLAEIEDHCSEARP